MARLHLIIIACALLLSTSAKAQDGFDCPQRLSDSTRSITGDGGFGLQRGFKKAGANTILISMWKVDDEATCLLMTEFYRNWLNGKCKHDTIEAAKHAVRSHLGREDPKYRTAFILLDGLD